MDTSHEYILMCEKAAEIQDWFYHKKWHDGYWLVEDNMAEDAP